MAAAKKTVQVGTRVEVTLGAVRWVSGEVRHLDADSIVAWVVLSDGRSVYLRNRGQTCEPCRLSPEVKRVRLVA